MTTDFFIGILIGIVVAPFIYVLMDVARAIHRHANNRTVKIHVPGGTINAENIDDIINDAIKDLPTCCAECDDYYTDDPYNHCCDHPDLDPAFTNINTKPKWTRMDGCPLG